MPHVINLLVDDPDWSDQAAAFEAAVTLVLRSSTQWWAPGRRLQPCYGDQRAVEFGPFPSAEGGQQYAWGRTPDELVRSLRDVLSGVATPTR